MNKEEREGKRKDFIGTLYKSIEQNTWILSPLLESSSIQNITKVLTADIWDKPCHLRAML